MAGIVHCTNCGAKLTTKNPVAPGKKMKCPKCGEIFVVEDDEAPEDEASENETDDESEHEPPPKKKVKPKQNDDEDQDEEEPPAKKPAAKPKSNVMLLVGIAGLLLLCVCGGAGAGVWFSWAGISAWLHGKSEVIAKDGIKDQPNTDKKDDNPKKDKPADPTKPAFVTNVDQLIEEFEKDRQAAHKKYSTKIVELTGDLALVFVSRAIDKVDNKLTIALESAPDQKKKWRIEMPVQPDDRQLAFRLSKGQKVKITAMLLTGGADRIYFQPGTLAEVTKSSIRAITSEELAAYFDKNPMAAEKQFGKQDLLVTGEVAEVNKDKATMSVSLILKGSDKTVISATVGARLDKSELDRIKVGSTVVLRDKDCRWVNTAPNAQVHLPEAIITDLAPAKGADKGP